MTWRLPQWVSRLLRRRPQRTRRAIVHYAQAGLPVCYTRRHTRDPRSAATTIMDLVTCRACIRASLDAAQDASQHEGAGALAEKGPNHG